MNFLSLSASLLFAVFASPSTFSQKLSKTEDRKLLQQLEYNWLMAEFKLDTATISKMMDDSFVSIGTNSISTKQEELNGIYENINQRIKDNHVVDSLYLDNVYIQFYGTVAIVSFVSVTKGKIKNIPFANRRTRMYDVWIKKDKQWKAVASQVTPIH